MTKKSQAEGSAEAPKGMVLIRRGMYRGSDGRSFQSSPAGEVLFCRSGQVYEVRESFAYLWLDPNFATFFEWKGEPEEVPAINEGQVPPPA